MKTILTDQHLEQLFNELPPGGSINLPVPEAMALQKYARYIKGVKLIRFPIDDFNRKLFRPAEIRHINSYTEDEFLGNWPSSASRFMIGSAPKLFDYWRPMCSDPVLKICSLTTFTRRLCDFASEGFGRVSFEPTPNARNKIFKVLSRDAFEQLFVEGEQMPEEAEAATLGRTDARTTT